jgi:hypothetical protein
VVSGDGDVVAMKAMMIVRLVVMIMVIVPH